MGREGVESPKIQFYKTIKEIEEDLGDPQVILDSFIISPTLLADMPQQTQTFSREAWEARNVLFQMDDDQGYIGKLFDKLC
jgi:hypothetical protein